MPALQRALPSALIRTMWYSGACGDGAAITRSWSAPNAMAVDGLPARSPDGALCRVGGDATSQSFCQSVAAWTPDAAIASAMLAAGRLRIDLFDMGSFLAWR